MKRIIALAFCLAAAGCKQEAPVSNAATEYADGMQSNVQQAQDAAADANAAIAAAQAQYADQPQAGAE
jgi:hypothetical protein